MPSKRIFSVTTGGAVASVLMLLAAGSAHATPAIDPDVYITVSGVAGGTSFTTGTAAGTYFEAPGTLATNVTLNDFVVNYANTTSDSLEFSLNGLTNTTGHQITVTFYVSANNFVGPGEGAFGLSDSGTVNADPATTNVGWAWYVDKNNGLGSLGTTPGSEIYNTEETGVPSSGPAGSSGSYSHNYGISKSGTDNTDEFSMTEVLTYILPAGASVGSSSITIDATDVPEPGSLLLLGTALLGIGVARRFNKGTGKGAGMAMSV
jgi:PEP-CTERM motif